MQFKGETLEYQIEILLSQLGDLMRGREHHVDCILRFVENLKISNHQAFNETIKENEALTIALESWRKKCLDNYRAMDELNKLEATND